MDNSESSSSCVPAVERTLNILEYLLVHKEATIKEIAAFCQIPTASTARLVKTLTLRGYLSEKKGQASQFTLGLKLLQYSQVVLQDLDLEAIAKPEMQLLSKRTQQTSQLAVLDTNSVMYTQVVFPNVPVSIIAPLRTPIAVNTSAAGKILCALLEEPEKSNFLSKIYLPKATEKSITDKQEFMRHLELVRKLGYGSDLEEFSQGIGCIAFPIFNDQGKAIAALGITGQFKQYDDPASFEKLRFQVQKGAENISRKLGAQV